MSKREQASGVGKGTYHIGQLRRLQLLEIRIIHIGGRYVKAVKENKLKRSIHKHL